MTLKRTNRYLYKSDFKSFIEADPYSILGRIHDAFHGKALTTTDEAWFGEIQILQYVLLPWKEEEAEIVFEYDIPRLGKRLYSVLLLRGIIFCLEFKVGQKDALQSDVEQLMDYALDLKNFHRYSHDRIIVPILIPTKHSSTSNSFTPSVYNDSIFNPLITGARGLQNIIRDVLRHANATSSSSIKDWILSPYTPTPTIIEAARSLYENHSVEDITRHEAVYLSGNGPLVAVLTEALARDNFKKSREKDDDKKLSDSRREVSKFIQIIHRYRDKINNNLR